MKSGVGRALSVAGFVGLGACVVSSVPDGASVRGPASSPLPPAVATAASPDVGTLRGPRVFDWSSSRIGGRATRGVSPAELLRANGGGGGVDWNVTTGSPVTSGAAVWGAAWVEATPDASDRLFFGVSGAGGASNGITGGASSTSPASDFFALTNLYGATPTLLWARSFSAGFDRSAATLSPDGTKVYAIDSGGNAHCMNAADGSSCGDVAGGCAVHGSSPWYDWGTNAIYFGDDCGYLHRVAGQGTFAETWKMKPGPSATYQGAIESSPVVWNGFIYVGDDLGQIFRVTDSSTAPVAGTSAVAIFAACTAVGSSAPCGSGWEIRTTVSIDSATSRVYAAANDYVFELQGGSGNWQPTLSSPKKLGSGATNQTMYAAPILDWQNGYAYTGLNGELFKIKYPFTGSSTSGISTTPLAGGTGAANPIAEPLPYTWTGGSAVFLGDAAGSTERFDCTTAAGPAAVDGVTPSYGSSINTPMILDYSTGNVNFGYSTAGGGGGLVQYPLTVGSYSCPAGQHLCTSSNGPANTCANPAGGNYGDACRGCCTSSDCGGATPTCVNGACQAGCSVAGDCPALPHTTATCPSGACVYACTTGFANCDGTEATNGCNVDTTTDVNDCGGCGLACSNNNIPSPTCAAGVCTGHCADGYVDCNGNRQSDGCETVATCGSCCGTTCTIGSTCYDNGGTGACVAGQTTQAAGTISQGSSVAVACPSGQRITGVTFADYGTPQGSAGQSWSTTSACGGLSQAACTPSGCQWNGSACVAFACTNLGAAACGTTTGCAWNSGTGTCIASACSGLAQGACGTTTGCAWNTAVSTCVSSRGFLHDYGTSGQGNNTYPPNCALDVQGDSVATACVSSASCSLSASNGVFGTGTSPSSGSTLPLTTTPPTPAGYPTDPCPSLAKRLYLETTCGACTLQPYAGEWLFDEGSGTVATDTSGNGDNGAVSATYTSAASCHSGTCLSFNDSSNLVNVPYGAALKFGTGAFTVGAWIKTSAGASENIVVGANRCFIGESWLLSVLNHKAAFATFGTGSAGGYISSPASVDDGAWHLVVGLRNGTSQQLYVDGALVASATISASFNSDSGGSTVIIGNLSGCTGREFGGLIDSVRIFGRALTATEIKEL